MFEISTTLDKLSEAPLPVTGTLCRYWSHLTGSLNTWGLWIGLGKCVLTCDESSLASTHTREKTGLCLAFLFHFFSPQFTHLLKRWITAAAPAVTGTIRQRGARRGGQKRLSHCQRLFAKQRSKVQGRDVAVASPAELTPAFIYSSVEERRWSGSTEEPRRLCCCQSFQGSKFNTLKVLFLLQGSVSWRRNISFPDSLHVLLPLFKIILNTYSLKRKSVCIIAAKVPLRILLFISIDC